MAALASFLGAFLLFALQPLIGKSLLPIYGGGAGPWIACMLFFQLVLLAGYGYAHALARLLGRNRALQVHGALAAASLLVLLLGARHNGAPWIADPAAAAGGLYPPLAILVTLAGTAGVPLLLLASTSPLIQAAFAALNPGEEPYRLYAVSNAGSLGGLLLYPFLLEPLLDLRVQAWGASLVFLIYLALLFSLLRKVPAPADVERAQAAQAPGRWWDRGRWIGLAALGTLWLCAVTNRVSTDVASMPLLWIPPLAAYLLTFILVFETRWSFVGPGWRLGLGCVVAALALVLGGPSFFNALLRALGPSGAAPFDPLWEGIIAFKRHLGWMVAFMVLACLSGCLLVHGRLAALRPVASRLTEYYLCISAGGALGGLLVSVACPLLFDQDYELAFSVAATGLLLLLAWRGSRLAARWPGLALGAFTVGLATFTLCSSAMDRHRFYARDFFGTLTVQSIHPKIIALIHGITTHGIQFIADPLRPTGYYGPDSGVGLGLRTLNAERPSMKVGLVGLGIGNTAAFGRSRDEYVFFEISPRIIEIAGPQGTFFSVLKRTPAKVRVVQGDGRIYAVKEAKERGAYDLLLIDAFAGGHIPAHLLTVEALRSYTDSLKPGGLLLLHVSHHLPLDRQVGANLKAAGLPSLLVAHPGVMGRDKKGVELPVEYGSVYWIVAKERGAVFREPFLGASHRAVLGPGEAPAAGSDLSRMAADLDAETASLRPWTDQRHGLSSLLVYALSHR